MSDAGCLWVVSTPLGHLGDLSPRAREVLGSVDFIVAEDTRVTRRLLAAVDLPAPELVACAGYEEPHKASRLVERLVAGASAAVVSDAGTPLVSDPGQHLVREAHARGVPVRTAPGPSAVAAALSVSGLPPVPFHFLSFPPRREGPIRRWLAAAGCLEGSLVVFESPRRLAALLRLMAEVLPDREVCLCRELTKLHEEVLRAPVRELAEQVAQREEVLGEVVLVVGPGVAPAREALSLDDGASLKAVAQVLADRWGIPRREAYQRLLDLEARVKG